MTQFQVGVKLRTYNHSLDAAMKVAQQKTGLTRVAFCKEILGVQYSQMAGYLSFKSYPKEERIVSIAISLNVNPDDIFPEAIAKLRLMKQPDPVVMPLEEAMALGFGPGVAPALEASEAFDRIGLPESIDALLHTLTEREGTVIVRLFGLQGHAIQLQRDLAIDLGLTTTRIGQIKQKALRKMRHPTRRHYVAELKDEVCAADWCVQQRGLVSINIPV